MTPHQARQKRGPVNTKEKNREESTEEGGKGNLDVVPLKSQQSLSFLFVFLDLHSAPRRLELILLYLKISDSGYKQIFLG